MFDFNFSQIAQWINSIIYPPKSNITEYTNHTVRALPDYPPPTSQEILEILGIESTKSEPTIYHIPEREFSNLFAEHIERALDKHFSSSKSEDSQNIDKPWVL